MTSARVLHGTPPARALRRAGATLAVALLALPLGGPRLAAQTPQYAVSRPATVVRLARDVRGDLVGVPAALRQPVTLKLHDVTVQRALQEVMLQTGIALTYSSAVVPVEHRVDLDVRAESAVDVLRRVLGDTGIELWVTAEGRMALVPGAPPAPAARTAQVGTVRGRVTARASGQPLEAANVFISGTRSGALTDAQGNYVIGAVPVGARTVVVQRIGFGRDSQTVSVPDGGTVTADFALRQVAVQLSEVVSIGYQQQARRDLTGSVASVDSEAIRSQPVQSVDQALQGRAAGVQVVTQSGQPGAGAMVRIRGGNSVSAGNQPLYVVDGVPVVASAEGANTNTLMTQGASGLNPIASLNPNDIESIDVLKDASAAAIYGSRAANGVVLITTKRGRQGQNQTSLSSYYMSSEVRRRLPLLNARQFATYVNEAYANIGQAPKFTADEIAAMGAGTNWQDAIFRTAPTKNVDLSFSGGDNDTRYYVSGNVLRQQGVVIGTNMDRGSFRLNFDQDLSNRFRIGNRVTFSREQGQVLPHGGGGQEVSSVVLNAILAPPTLPVKTSGGEYFTGDNPLTGRPFANPVASAKLITNQEQQNRIIGNGFAEFDLLKHLTVRSTLGIDYLTSMQNFYSPSNTLPGRNFSGQGSRGTAQTTTWQNENTLHWQNTYGINAVDVLGGLSLQRTRNENVSGTAQGFLTDALGTNGLSTANTFVGVYTGAPHSSLASYFARGNWGILDRYLLTLSGRIDGSSKFGEGNQYGFFPSAAFAWRLSNEPFIKNLGVFDNLKLRLGYGETGNQDIGNYAALATLRPTTYVFGTQRAIGFVANNLANPDLKWETTTGTNAGLDLTVWHNRLDVTADAYHKKTTDLLLYVPVPATSGFGSSLQNVGSVQNNGFELAVNTVNLQGAFGWTSSLNLAWNRNKVLDLGPDKQIVAPVGVGAGANQNPTILRVGQPINSFYGWVFAGLDSTGQPTYKDLNGDTTITEADRRIIGSAQPNYTGGFSNRVTWGGFGLDVFIQFSVGNKIYNINRALLTSTNGTANQLTDVLHAGKGAVPTPKIGNTFESRPSTLFVEDGSYIRGKNIRLTYDVPTSWISRSRAAGVSSLQLYVGAQNFFTSTDYTGYDPEISEYALSNLAQGLDFGTYPQPRQIIFGFNAGF